MNDRGERSYSNGEITVFWDATVCIHSGNCVRAHGGVFSPKRRPWVDMSQGSTEEITSAVDSCPSGALRWQYNWELGQHEAPVAATGVRITVRPNGPLIVKGAICIERQDGSIVERSGSTAFCRCGYSKEKPFCDGSHDERGFKG